MVYAPKSQPQQRLTSAHRRGVESNSSAHPSQSHHHIGEPSQVVAPSSPARLGFPASPPHHGRRRLRRRVRRGRGRRRGGQVAERRVAGVPVLPGPLHPARHGPLGRHPRRRRDLRPQGLHGPRLLHRQLRPRDLPPQPPHRLPLPHGRPRARPLRRAGRARAAHPRLRRVQAIHQAPTRVQVLVCNHKSFCGSFCDDFLLCIRCSCLLAYTSLLLDCTFRPDDEAPDSAYGQVQICAFQYWKAEIWREERGWRKHQFFERLIPSRPWWGSNGRARRYS